MLLAGVQGGKTNNKGGSAGFLKYDMSERSYFALSSANAPIAPEKWRHSVEFLLTNLQTIHSGISCKLYSDLFVWCDLIQNIPMCACESEIMCAIAFINMPLSGHIFLSISSPKWLKKSIFLTCLCIKPYRSVWLQVLIYLSLKLH